MNREAVLAAARSGHLYPAVILHGSTALGRREFAYRLARTLLCDAEPEARPCGACRHCRRIVDGDDPGLSGDNAPFHPDFELLERDTKTSTSVDATRELLKAAFTFYVANLADYRSSYGNFATVIVLFLWIYWIAIVFIIGGEVGQVAALQRIRRRQKERLK